jgi:hypothetical protein
MRWNVWVLSCGVTVRHYNIRSWIQICITVSCNSISTLPIRSCQDVNLYCPSCFLVITVQNIPIFHRNCHFESWHVARQWFWIMFAGDESKLQISVLVIACLWFNKESSGTFVTSKYKWTEYCNVRMYKIHQLFGILHYTKHCYITTNYIVGLLVDIQEQWTSVGHTDAMH